jgi:hypothetical protein
MKLAIPNNGAAAKIVTDAEAEALHETHRLVSVRETSRGRSVVHYVDVWGGTWTKSKSDETECTVGVMEKWA